MAVATPIAPGAGAALVTLFSSDGALLAAETGILAARLVDAGARSVLVGGTVGEFYALTDDERAELFARVRSAVPADVPVIGHIGGVPVDRAVWLARAGADAGLTALLALAAGTAGLGSYYGAIAEAAPLPLLAYHLPQSGAAVPLEDMPGLPVTGIKDSSGDGGRLAAEVFTLDTEVYTGATALLGLAHDIGAAGAFLGLANARPELCVQAIEGDSDAQKELARLGVWQAGDFPGKLKELAAARWDVPAFTRTPTGRRVGQFALNAG